MSSPVETVTAAVSAREAARRLRDRAVSSLVVVEDGRLIGIVTTTDLADYVASGAMESTVETEPQRHRYRPDTAYERDDWGVQSYGDEDGLGVGDRVTFAKTISAEDVAAFGRDRYRLETSVETDAGQTVIEGQATVLADPLPEDS